MTKWNWTGTLAAIVVFAVVVPSPVLRSLGVPGYTSFLIPTIAIAIAAVLGAAQYVQLSLRERNDHAEARRLRQRP